MTAEFQPFPKIARLNRDIVITEKIDGSNAAINIAEDGTITAQSRNRVISLNEDNYGFARWVDTHAYDLVRTLGPGLHFGEWWGAGIQRRYGQSEKFFSLFNVGRWADVDLSAVPNLRVVPTLYEGPFDQTVVDYIVWDRLPEEGSVAAPGFMDPEGIVVWHSAARQMFKVTCKDDESPKSQVA